MELEQYLPNSVKKKMPIFTKEDRNILELAMFVFSSECARLNDITNSPPDRLSPHFRQSKDVGSNLPRRRIKLLVYL